MDISSDTVAQIKTFGIPLLIGVSGFGGAGKSTFARALGEALGAPVIGVDSFMKDRTADYSRWEGIDYARLKAEVVVPFLAGANPIRYGHFDWTTNGVIKTNEIQHDDIIIVEGVGLFRPELKDLFGYKVWVDCPVDEATRRGKKRDREEYKNPQDENWDGIWKRNDEEHFEAHSPKEAADFIFKNC
ncbi:MAG: AAA family ATPase [Patescibacteria group bacterium]|nr:AAA family ATPase [Patescibacteria group bacterium]